MYVRINYHNLHIPKCPKPTRIQKQPSLHHERPLRLRHLAAGRRTRIACIEVFGSIELLIDDGTSQVQKDIPMSSYGGCMQTLSTTPHDYRPA